MLIFKFVLIVLNKSWPEIHFTDFIFLMVLKGLRSLLPQTVLNL